ncbi:putative protein lysine methyltransferase SET6 [Meyerozyma sp. JA9]|nr:putative protein lysine methyltransferase SET6 [Meyerozyma sp. JA9]
MHGNNMPHSVDLGLSLSRFFEIAATAYGRGCIATSDIPSGTTLLECAAPLGACVIRPFRKEVCQRCYEYNDGKTLKFRIENKKGSIYFCSEACRASFEEEDNEGILRACLFDLEHWYRSNSCEDDYDDGGKGVETAWKDVEAWEQELSKLKRKSDMVPKITETDYSDLIYILDVMFSQYKGTNQLELSLFAQLQTNEQDKVAKYPYLLSSYTRMYKYLKLTCGPQLQPFITIDNIRKIIGTSLTNAFGIWSSTAPGEDKEYFGCALYPSASFFNHSCSANVSRIRHGRSVTFVTSQPVPRGEELCIQYGNHTTEDYQTRQKDLREWFFECGCKKCEMKK